MYFYCPENLHIRKNQVAQLLLNDGTRVTGKPFGALRSVSGEVVFNTAMTGYPESLTDPSYKGQILVLTYPLIGNYGVPGKAIRENLSTYFESDRIHVSGLVISSYTAEYSHWNALENLSDWLLEHDVPGISGIDTRAIVKLLREQGTMLGSFSSMMRTRLYSTIQIRITLSHRSPLRIRLFTPAMNYRSSLWTAG